MREAHVSYPIVPTGQLENNNGPACFRLVKHDIACNYLELTRDAFDVTHLAPAVQTKAGIGKMLLSRAESR